MTHLTDADYIAQRLDNQMEWFERKCAYNQKAYKRLRMVELLAAALIPLLSGIDSTRLPHGTLIIGVLGMLIALIAGAMSLFKFHENWLQYRVTGEALKHERFMYLCRTGPYGADNRYPLLVERVEKILMKENAAWAQTASANDGSGAGKDTAAAPAVGAELPAPAEDARASANETDDRSTDVTADGATGTPIDKPPAG
jgi:Protein of unknown function (DUF4231)